MLSIIATLIMKIGYALIQKGISLEYYGLYLLTNKFEKQKINSAKDKLHGMSTRAKSVLDFRAEE